MNRRRSLNDISRTADVIVDIILGSEQSSRRLGKVAFGFPSSSDADAARSAAIASFLSAFAIVASLSDPTSLVGRHYWSRHDDLLISEAAHLNNSFSSIKGMIKTSLTQ